MILRNGNLRNENKILVSKQKTSNLRSYFYFYLNIIISIQ